MTGSRSGEPKQSQVKLEHLHHTQSSLPKQILYKITFAYECHNKRLDHWNLMIIKPYYLWSSFVISSRGYQTIKSCSLPAQSHREHYYTSLAHCSSAMW
ncbi:hypothetical protein ABKN59_007318 [Abortiporus biennis]